VRNDGHEAATDREPQAWSAGVSMRQTTGWTIVLTACMLAALGREGLAQSPAPAAGRSTMSGVYTFAQANRGKNVYAGMCRSCHTPASHTGETFATWWGGRHLSDLFTYVSQTMPKNAPATLSKEEYADVVAYLLRMNGFPTGGNELPADSVALTKIRIEMRPTPP
jgi:mono/diheme cytochrome c family protein